MHTEKLSRNGAMATGCCSSPGSSAGAVTRHTREKKKKREKTHNLTAGKAESFQIENKGLLLVSPKWVLNFTENTDRF